MSLNGKIALITGASSGIGLETAKRFARHGAGVVACARNAAALAELEAEIAAAGGQARAWPADLQEPAACRQVVDFTIEQFGRLDILVNAAGVIAFGTIQDTSPADWDRMMQINVNAVFCLIQAAIPHLEKTRGNVVNVSSVTGVRAFPNIFAYCVSKAAVDQLTRCAALDLAPKGIRVNAVNPGVVVTNLHRASGMSEEAYRQFLDHSKTTHPLGRVGEPGEIAESIRYLASEQAGWVTGVTLSIDGGRHLTCAR